MPQQVIKAAHVEPVFIESMNLPDNIDIPAMCRAGERVVGSAGIEGAFPDGGLWRIYPMTPVGRAKLLAKGLDIGGKWVATDAANPFILRGHDLDQPSTRLTVGPLPFSMSDDAVIRALEREGLKIRGKMSWEMARLKDRTMTGWKTGRRIVWIELPASPPRKLLEIGPLRVEIYYREMREQTSKCWNCKEFGHRSAQCPVDTVCFVCHLPGHKKGDPMCYKGLNVDQESEDDDSELGGDGRPSDTDLQGDLGTDDEERGGGTSVARYIDIPQAALIAIGPRDSPTDDTTQKPAEQTPLPSDSDDDASNRTFTATCSAPEEKEDCLNRTSAATKGADGSKVTSEVHRRKVKATRRSYADVVSQGESSSSEDDEVPFTKVPVRKTQKGKAGNKGRAAGKSDKLRQSNITSFAGITKRATTETSPDADARGSQSQKQRF